MTASADGGAHPVLAALDEAGFGWLAGFAEQGFEDIAGVVAVARDEPAVNLPPPSGV